MAPESGPSSSSVFKWIGGVATAVVAAVIIWLLTGPDGILQKRPPLPKNPADEMKFICLM